MKSKTFILSALFLSAILATAQTGDKKATIRIKKITTENGLEKISDTSYTTDGNQVIKTDGGTINIEEVKDKDGNLKRIIMVNDDLDKPSMKDNDNDKTSEVEIDSPQNHSGKNLQKIVNITAESDSQTPGGTMFINTMPPLSDAEKKQFKVRVKTIQTINGVEKITDTTYNSQQLPDLQVGAKGNSLVKFPEETTFSFNQNALVGDSNNSTPQKAPKDVKMVIIDKRDGTFKSWPNSVGDVNSSSSNPIKMDNVFINDEGADTLEGKTIMIKHLGTCNPTQHQMDSVNDVVVVTIVKRVRVTNANDTEIKSISKTSGISDNKLALDKIDFYPNPNNGKFNLSFDLKEKGNTTVSIMTVDGKKIYNENLADFSGHYTKEIDISENPKGIYFVKIEQGKHAQLKKLVLE